MTAFSYLVSDMQLHEDVAIIDFELEELRLTSPDTPDFNFGRPQSVMQVVPPPPPRVEEVQSTDDILIEEV